MIAHQFRSRAFRSPIRLCQSHRTVLININFNRTLGFQLQVG
jgi:hypothetical protein